MQSLLGRDPGKVADGEKVRARTWSGGISLQVNADRDHVDFALGYPKIMGHEVGVIAAHRHESINVLEVGADQVQR